MNKIDKYIQKTISKILEDGNWDKDPRPKYADGTPARSKYITQQVFKYDILKGEFPITTLRTTPLKGCFYDIKAIYLKQTNILEEMHPSIHSWWKDFCREKNDWKEAKDKFDFKMSSGFNIWGMIEDDYEDKNYRSLGATYGHTVKKYNLMNKLLKSLEETPFSRRHSINLNQEQQKIDDPEALQPCAFETLWAVREIDEDRIIDLTLIQRSQDFLVTAGINGFQYCMLGMMVCNHLTFKTGIKHILGSLLHVVNNCHIYERHFEAAKEILSREPLKEQPKLKLNCLPKDFYSHTVEDFDFILPAGIEKLSNKLEIAI